MILEIPFTKNQTHRRACNHLIHGAVTEIQGAVTETQGAVTETQGAVTETFVPDRLAVLKLLNEALATEIVCVLRYRCHYFMARGIYAKTIAEEFMQHSNEELGHVDLLASRIVQLGGKPNFDPDQIDSLSRTEFLAGESLLDMIAHDLVAERSAIASYRELLLYVGDKDPTTSHMVKSILAVEEEHAGELADLLGGLLGDSMPEDLIPGTFLPGSALPENALPHSLLQSF
jgi:bacterioferritin